MILIKLRHGLECGVLNGKVAAGSTVYRRRRPNRACWSPPYAKPKSKLPNPKTPPEKWTKEEWLAYDALLYAGKDPKPTPKPNLPAYPPKPGPKDYFHKEDK